MALVYAVLNMVCVISHICTLLGVTVSLLIWTHAVAYLEYSGIMTVSIYIELILGKDMTEMPL